MKQATVDNMECEVVIGLLTKYEQWIDGTACSTVEKLSGKRLAIFLNFGKWQKVLKAYAVNAARYRVPKI